MIDYVSRMTDALDSEPTGAIEQLKKDDASGNLDATFLLGKVYYDNLYALPNSGMAISLWEKGAQKGNLNCLRALGDAYLFGFGYEENNEKALELYSQILGKDPDDYQAICQIGRMYSNGWGVNKNTEKALSLFEEAWRKGSGRAAAELGDIYLNDMDETDGNLQTAMKWYQRGADLNNPRANLVLGISYNLGLHGLPESHQMAYKCLLNGKKNSKALSLLITLSDFDFVPRAEMNELLEEAERRAGYGDVQLQEALGDTYSTGDIKRNRETATYWYEKAIENGSTSAAATLGENYADGSWGYRKDISKAYNYLLLAAQGGEETAMKKLAELLEENSIPGLSDEEKESQLIHWYEEAASNGNIRAALKLGERYEEGRSTAQREKAIHYYQMAADREIESAYLPLGRLYTLPTALTDYRLAHRYLSLAQRVATSDDQISEIELCYGRMNKNGWGIPKNLEEAQKHFSISAAKGNKEAAEELTHFKKGLFGWKLI